MYEPTQTQIEAAVPSRTLDPRIGHADSSFGLLHVWPIRPPRLHPASSAGPALAGHELFECVAELERSVCRSCRGGVSVRSTTRSTWPACRSRSASKPAQLDLHHVALERWRTALFDPRAQQVGLTRRRRDQVVADRRGRGSPRPPPRTSCVRRRPAGARDPRRPARVAWTSCSATATRPVLRNRSSGHWMSTRLWLSVPPGSYCCMNDTVGLGWTPGLKPLAAGHVHFGSCRAKRRLLCPGRARWLRASVMPVSALTYCDARPSRGFGVPDCARTLALHVRIPHAVTIQNRFVIALSPRS